MRKLFLLVVAALALLSATPPAQAATTYTAPYAVGPKGGDQYNTYDVKPEIGTVTVVRHNAAPGAIGCAGSGGFAYLRVEHAVTDAVSSVNVAFAEATITPFTWISVEVRDATGFVGSARLRGQQVAGSGTIPVALDRSPALGDTLTIDFGLQVASACPNVDGGTVRFPSVEVA